MWGWRGGIRRRRRGGSTRLPRRQRGRDWTRARAGVVPRAPPRLSALPLPLHQPAVREPRAQCKLRRGAQEAAALAAPQRRSAPGTRRRAASHGPAQGPPGGLGAQPLARYVPLLPAGAPAWATGASGPVARSGMRCTSQGPTLATRGDSGPPGTGCSLAAPPSPAQEGGARERLVAGSWVCLGKS